MRVYVINLVRRPDRRARIATRLNGLGLQFSFVDATDSKSIEPSQVRQVISLEESCCVRSHALAMETFLQSDEEYAIVMEDDAVPSPAVDWVSVTWRLESEMAAKGLSYLQLGFISQAYETNRIGTMKRALAQKIFRNKVPPSLNFNLAGKNHKIIVGESRAGSHCYIINRAFAELAPAFNEPAWVSHDGFFDRLATANGTTGSFLMGRLQVSLAEQESRQAGLDQIDSDIS